MSLLLARRKIIARPSGPFAYPGIAPGFDPSHVAAQNIRFSGAAASNGFASILTGAPSSLLGVPTNKIIGLIGPTRVYTSVQGDRFTGQNPALDDACTLGAIFFGTTASSVGFISTAALSNGGSWLG